MPTLFEIFRVFSEKIRFFGISIGWRQCCGSGSVRTRFIWPDPNHNFDDPDPIQTIRISVSDDTDPNFLQIAKLVHCSVCLMPLAQTALS